MGPPHPPTPAHDSVSAEASSPPPPPPPIPKKGETAFGPVFEELTRGLSQIRGEIEFSLPDDFFRGGESYIAIKRNIYLTKRRPEDDGIFCACEPLNGSSTRCDGDCHCTMLFSCCSSNCKCSNTCANKPFQLRPVKKLKVVKTEKCGFGLVAEEDIKQGEFVIEYVGEVIDDKTCEERLWKMKRRGAKNFYLCEVNSNMVIDATYKGNKSRFINHSCDPNTEMQKWIDLSAWDFRKGCIFNCGSHLSISYDSWRKRYDYFRYMLAAVVSVCEDAISVANIRNGHGRPLVVLWLLRKRVEGETRVGIFALRDIKKGEDVTYDYMFVQFGADQDCHCGSFHCKEKLGRGGDLMLLKKKGALTKDCIQSLVRVWRHSHQMWVEGYIYSYDDERRMHTIMFGDGSLEELDLEIEAWNFLPQIKKFRR